MLRRPLTVVMVSLIVWLFLWYQWHSPEDSHRTFNREVGVLGEVESISERPSGRSIVLKPLKLQNKMQSEQNEVIPCRGFIIYMDSKKMDIHSIQKFNSLQIGNIILLEGSVSSFSLPGNPGQFNEFLYYKQLNIDGCMFARSCKVINPAYNKYRQFLFGVRSYSLRILQDLLPEKESGIIAAMLFGEKSQLSEDTKNLYQQIGISHLLAISGLHISILGNALFLFLRKYFFSLKTSAVITILLLFTYGSLTGFSTSATRAIGMSICMLIGTILGRAYDMASGLSLMGIITLIQNPLLLFNPGFLLSYSTIAGILLVNPMMGELVPETVILSSFGKAGDIIRESVLGSLGIFLTTTPIILYFYYEVALYGVIVNLFVLPLVSLLVGGGFVSVCLSVVSYAIGKFSFGTVHYILMYYEWIGMIFKRLPHHMIRTGQPQMWRIVFYYTVLLAVCILRIYIGRRIYVLLLFLIVIFLPKSESDFSFTMLDVGQGDALYIYAEGKNILIDGGSSSVSEVGKYRITPFLKWRGVNKVDYIFVSHSDADHTNGILELIEKQSDFDIEVGCVLLPDIEKKDEGYMEFERKCGEKNIKVLKIKKGDSMRFGNLKARCLHPARDYDWKSENDYSMVLNIEHEGLSLMLTGDLESEGEGAAMPDASKVHVLKVGHHGSKTSSTKGFMEKIQPRLALISAGEKNRYGHPSKATLETLKEINAKILTTIDCGAITLNHKGISLFRQKT